MPAEQGGLVYLRHASQSKAYKWLFSRPCQYHFPSSLHHIILRSLTSVLPARSSDCVLLVLRNSTFDPFFLAAIWRPGRRRTLTILHRRSSRRRRSRLPRTMFKIWSQLLRTRPCRLQTRAKIRCRRPGGRRQISCIRLKTL